MSRRHGLELAGVAVYALVDWLVIMAPAFAIELAGDRGGLGDTEGLDLLSASAVIATIHAIVAARRLRDEERMAVRRADVWIASIDALVVLALGTTLLVLAGLVSFPDEHAALANRGYPVVLLWAGLQILAVLLAEVTGRLVFRWLEPPEVAAPGTGSAAPGGETEAGEGAVTGADTDGHVGADDTDQDRPDARQAPTGG